MFESCDESDSYQESFVEALNKKYREPLDMVKTREKKGVIFFFSKTLTYRYLFGQITTVGIMKKHFA
jgi:hypothetical protein